MVRFYLDTCIWLNLFKREGDTTKGVPYWKIARDFIDYVGMTEGKIFVSTIVLRELQYKSGDRYGEVKEFFKKFDFISVLSTTNQDYESARISERKHQSLSFFDYLHVAVAKRLGAILITRDRELLLFARNHVKVNRPENLLR